MMTVLFLKKDLVNIQRKILMILNCTFIAVSFFVVPTLTLILANNTFLFQALN